MAVKKKVTAMDKVKLARDAKRPHLMDFLGYIANDFEELHGDRLVNDDRGLIAGFATIDKEKVLVLGHHKGATVEENVEANFGMGRSRTATARRCASRSSPRSSICRS